jgi:NAD(P)-dependent dehydrogenase (short-subunit alcohol dehydrogenase family)
MHLDVAFVAGGTGGLGRAICTALAAAGRSIFFTYRDNVAAAEALAKGIGPSAAYCRADLTIGADIEAAWGEVGRFGAVGSVIYAAGPPIPQRWFSQVSAQDWRAGVTAEIDSFFNLAQSALPHLRSCAGASLVAVTSFATRRAIAGDVLSAVPKAAIEMLVRQIAREEGRYGIRANCVAPGIIDAGLGRKAQQDHYTPEIWEAQRRAVPLRCFGPAEAIADAVTFLVSPQAAYITGQSIVVDGGMSA